MLQCSMNGFGLDAFSPSKRSPIRRPAVPRGGYTAKQDRKKSISRRATRNAASRKKEAEPRAWATVNKQDKGGKNVGSGRKSSRSEAAKKGWGNPPAAAAMANS